MNNVSRVRNGHRNDCDEMIRILLGSMTFAKVLRRCVLEMMVSEKPATRAKPAGGASNFRVQPTFSRIAVKETSTEQQSQTAHKHAVIRFSVNHHVATSLFRILILANLSLIR